MHLVSLFGKTYLWMYDENMNLYLSLIGSTRNMSIWTQKDGFREFEWNGVEHTPHWTICSSVCLEFSGLSDRVIVGPPLPMYTKVECETYVREGL